MFSLVIEDNQDMSTCVLQPLGTGGKSETALAQAMTEAFIGDFTRLDALDGGARPMVTKGPGDSRTLQGLSKRISVVKTTENLGRITGWQYQPSRSGRTGQEVVMRNLISGICHSFNNILMGIQGNSGLIRYRSAQLLAIRKILEEIELYVQAGAFVTNLLLAYLGERRQTARKIRCKQLVDEIIKSVAEDQRTVVAGELYEQLVWAARVKSPRLVAGASAKLMNTLLAEIGGLLENVNGIGQPGDQNRCNLDQIGVLVAGGKRLAERLAIYAGDMVARLKSDDLKPMLKRLVRDTRKRNLELKIDLDFGRQTRAVTDLHLLGIGLQELLANAVEACQSGGLIKVEVFTGEEQNPRERFGRNGNKHLLAVMVKDNGRGMDYKTKLRAFDPFFTTGPRCRGKGLGLAVASGVARSLGGYIYLRSRKGQGTTVGFHLPLEGPGRLVTA